MLSRASDWPEALAGTAGSSAAVKHPATIHFTAARNIRCVSGLTHEPPRKTTPVPVQIARQPFPQLETALSRGPIAPCCGHLGDTQAHQVRLHGQLDAELEPTGRFDRDLVQKSLRVEAEVAGGVVNRQAPEPVQRQTGGAGPWPVPGRGSPL